MPLEVPKAPKVRTTEYTNFRGVDFTNDSTNVWYRRSPDAVNMLPDDSGRPFKRTGWEVVVTVNQLSTALGGADTEIYKCHYFELAGQDHILIFAKGGVFVYRLMEEIIDGEPTEVDDFELLSTTNGYSGNSTDIDCYSSFDRAFFFEGDGTAAFYIYGNYKVWRYGYNVDSKKFTFEKLNDGFDAGDITIPVVLIATDPSTCTGTLYSPYNLIGGEAAVEYQNNAMLYTYKTSTAFTYTFDDVKFKATAGVTADATYTFTYSSSQWNLDKDARGTHTYTSNVTLSANSYGIVVTGTPNSGDKIFVAYKNGVLLPRNVAQDQYDKVLVNKMVDGKYEGNSITVKQEEAGDPLAPYYPANDGECVLHTDVDSIDKRAWIEFYSAITPEVAEEDCIRVAFPVSLVTITPYSEVSPDSSTISINGKA